MVSATTHTAESRRAITRAEDALARDDMAEASTLIWDAAAAAMRSIAQSRGWAHEDENDLIHAAMELARETGLRDISTLVQVAHTTSWLVDEGWITKSWVASDVESTAELLQILDSLDIE